MQRLVVVVGKYVEWVPRVRWSFVEFLKYLPHAKKMKRTFYTHACLYHTGSIWIRTLLWILVTESGDIFLIRPTFLLFLGDSPPDARCWNDWAEQDEYYPIMLFVNFLLPLFSGKRKAMTRFGTKLRRSDYNIRADRPASPQNYPSSRWH